MILKEEKDKILKKISDGLDNVEHGTITISLRGPTRPIDVEISDRTRFEIQTVKK